MCWCQAFRKHRERSFSALRRTWNVARWRCLAFPALSVPGDRDSLALDFRAAQSCFLGSQMWIEDAGLRGRGRFPSPPSPLLSCYPITPYCLFSLTDSWLKFKALGILFCSGSERMTEDKCDKTFSAWMISSVLKCCSYLWRYARLFLYNISWKGQVSVWL